MAKNIKVYDLLEVYGSLLTEKQKNMLEYYYFDDLSLSEIAENEGGSRQGAQDLIKRAEKELLKFEEILGAVNRSKQQSGILQKLQIAANKGDLTDIKLLLKELEKTV